MAESITEGTLKQWLKQKGDYVEADEEVATIETDKVRVCPWPLALHRDTTPAPRPDLCRGPPIRSLSLLLARRSTLQSTPRGQVP